MIQARQKKINDKCKEIVVSSASDQTTMESIVSAQHGLQTINQVVQIANIALLKLWSILISKARKVLWYKPRHLLSFYYRFFGT